MEYWQKRAIVKVSKINFMNDLEEIKKVFSTLCEPLTKYDGIAYSEGVLAIGGKTYSLSVGINTLGITYNHNLRGEVTEFFIINELGEYAFSSSHLNKIPEFKPLETLLFDYNSIINSIMNKIIR